MSVKWSQLKAIPTFALMLFVVVLTASTSTGSGEATPLAASRTFPETGKTVSGRFLEYWDAHGGLAQQGYPISDEMQERSDIDGKAYTVQYFERAVFELHPEKQPPYDVLLSLLGVLEQRRKYPGGVPNTQPDISAGSVLFPETGKRLGGEFPTTGMICSGRQVR